MTRLMFMLIWLSLGVPLQAVELPEHAAPLTVREAFIDLRSGPGSAYPVVQVAERGDVVYPDKRRTGWIRVTTRRGFRGWVATSDLLSSVAGSDYEAQLASADTSMHGSHKWRGGFLLGDFAGATALYAYAGWQFTPNLSTELHLGQAVGDFSDSRIALIYLRHTLFPANRFTPWLALGAGGITTRPDASLALTTDRSDSLLALRGGVDWRLARNYVLSLEYTSYTILTNRNDNEEVEEWKFGINAWFW
ncbi:MAG: SH3 domain-containing protein [Pseudomonadales bacterium]|nr:SH3 domain-containing protein [Pseudomonadales bacterium]